MIQFTPFSPVFLQIGALQFHYYGLMYAIAIGFLYFVLPKIYTIRNIQISPERHEGLLLTATITALIGGRLMYVFGYNASYFIEYPLQILAVHKGGMASHGGFLGAIIGGYYYTKKHNLPFWKLADCFAMVTGICLALGRVGNLINQEL